MDADGFFQLHDTFAWQPIRVCNPTNPNWLPCKHIVELEETVSIHDHAKGVPDATMTSVALQLASGPKGPLKKKNSEVPALFFFSGSFGPYASWNATDVIVASGTPFAWLWMLTVSSNSTICLHGSQLGFVTLLNPNWLPCKHIVELEETVSIHNHAKGVPDAMMTSVAFQLASGPKEPLKEKKNSEVPALFCFFFFQRVSWTGCQLERN